MPEIHNETSYLLELEKKYKKELRSAYASSGASASPYHDGVIDTRKKLYEKFIYDLQPLINRQHE